MAAVAAALGRLPGKATRPAGFGSGGGSVGGKAAAVAVASDSDTPRSAAGAGPESAGDPGYRVGTSLRFLGSKLAGLGVEIAAGLDVGIEVDLDA